MQPVSIGIKALNVCYVGDALWTYETPKTAKREFLIDNDDVVQVTGDAVTQKVEASPQTRMDNRLITSRPCELQISVSGPAH